MNEAGPAAYRQHQTGVRPDNERLSELALVHDGRTSILRCRQWVPADRSEVFQFFSDAYNLEAITPPFLRFAITYVSDARVQAGTRLRYRLRLHGWPVRWSTLIEAFEAPERFLDVQTRGPFRHWHHVHRFAACDGGTLLEDEVTYRLYLPWRNGTPLLRWVHRDVKAIFAYRQDAIAKRFG